MNGSTPWIQLCGKSDPELERILSDRVAAKRAAGKFALHDEEYIRRVSLMVLREGGDVSPELLEKFRHLCLLHNVHLIPPKISSHRRFIGPIIVAGKKLAYRILAPLLESTIRQQRDFNAAAIYLLAELSRERNDSVDKKGNG